MSDNHYVDNDKLKTALTEYAIRYAVYKTAVAEIKEAATILMNERKEATKLAGESPRDIVLEVDYSPAGARPPMSNYLGECILKIASNTVYRPNFINYPYRDEMVGDAVENCVRYVHNYDPEAGISAFSYITQICWNSYVRRISREKEEYFFKVRAIQSNTESHLADFEGNMSELRGEEITHLQEYYDADLKSYEESRLNDNQKRRIKTQKTKKTKTKKMGLSRFVANKQSA